MKKKSKKSKISTIIFVIILLICSIYYKDDIEKNINENESSSIVNIRTTNSIPTFEENTIITINNNEPIFDNTDKTEESFEKYGELDSLGRCTAAYANVSEETMPTEKRESIGSVKPTGWQTAKYDNIDGKYLYNRCHLIGYQLTGENANKKNLITCTRQANARDMLKYENQVAEYVKKTHNHVLYRVTPVFKDTNLLATGIQMEALSVEDNGDGIKFNIFIYNVQDGIEIDYKTGKSKLK